MNKSKSKKETPVMLGARSGLQTLVPSLSPDAVLMYCMIHRQAQHRKLFQNLFRMF